MLQVEQAGGKRQTSVSRVFLQTWFIENAPTTPAEQAHTPHGGSENPTEKFEIFIGILSVCTQSLPKPSPSAFTGVG